LGNTAIQKDFQILKSFLNYATEYGFNTLQEYHKFKFKRADVTKISLSEEDVSAMQNLDLSNNLRLEKVRDMFLFMCSTSLRYSDMQAIKPGNIQTTQLDGQMITYMDLIAQKTRGEIQSPLSPYALKLIDKYKGGYYCFPRISNQRFNSYLKEVAQLAQINEKITIVRFVGTERIETEFSKHELVCCHTARRTFVTQFFEKGGNSTACMVFTGHKDPKELETYRKKTLQHRLKLTRDFAAMAT
jgi:integrase